MMPTRDLQLNKNLFAFRNWLVLRAVGMCLAALSSIFNFSFVTAGETDEVTRAKVAEGVKQFSSGSYNEAASSFSEAAELAPDNWIIRFDRACALMAAGDESSARELFLQSALSKDTKISSASYYNLACIAVDQARAILGENPVDAAKESRDKAIERLQAADVHFRDSLRVDPTNQDARHNLELLRNFVNDLQSKWKQIDHQRELQHKDLFELLVQLDDQQAELRHSVRRLQTQSSKNTPRFERQKIANSQLALSRDTNSIDEQIQQLLSSANAGPTSPTKQPGANEAQDESTKQIGELLKKIVEQTTQDMKSAADEVVAANWSAAHQKQRSASDHLREIYALLQQLPVLVDREIAIQEALLALHDPLTVSGNSSQSDNSPRGQSNSKIGDDSPDGQAWQQQWIALFTQALAAKARAMQQTLPSDKTIAEPSIDESGQPASDQLNSQAETSEPTQGTEAAESAGDSMNNTTTEANEDKRSDDEVKAEQQQLQQLRTSLNLIAERSPEIIELSKQASEQLSKQQFDAARPNQLEILKLLKQIAESLPKQPPQDSSKNNQSDKNENKKDDDKQNGNDQNKSNQDKRQQNKNDQKRNDQENNNQENDNEQNNNSDKNRDQQKSIDQNKDDTKSTDQNSQDKQPQDNQDGTKQPNGSENKSESKDNKDAKDKSENSDSPTPDSKQAGQDKAQQQEKSKQDDPQERKDGAKSEDPKSQANNQPASASNAADGNASQADKQQQAQKLAEQRAQVILGRIREREAKYRELLQQLRELQGKRSPVEKDW